MRLAMIGLVSLIVGVLGGALFSGNRMKNAILEERAQVAADSPESLGGSDVASAAQERAGAGSPRVAPSTDRTNPEDRPGVPDRGAGEASTPGARSSVTTAALDPPSGERSGPERASTGTGASTPEVGGNAVSVGVDEAATGAAGPTSSGGPEVAPTGTEVAAPAGVVADSAAIQGAMQLARMFSSMKAVDAAAVLQELTDAEVDAILRHMQSRLAGQILGEFEPARAALLSRTVLGGTPTP